MGHQKSRSWRRIAAGANSLACILLIILAITSMKVRCQLQQQQQQHKSAQHQNITTKHSMQQLSSIWQQSQPSSPAIPSTFRATDAAETAVTLSGYMLQTFIRANNMRAYDMDLHSYRPDAKFSGDPVFVDSENVAHKRRCQRDLEVYKQALESVIEFDPTSERNQLDHLLLADSFGRPEAGALRGSQFWIGAYDQCLDIKMMKRGERRAIDSQYCLGMTQFPNWNPNEARTSIKVGLCLPVTCTSSMINENTELLGSVEKMMKNQFGGLRPYSKLRLKEVYCLPHETSQIRQYSASAICFFLVISIFVAIGIIATALDHYNTTTLAENSIKEQQQQQQQQQARNWRQIIIESFSITRNLNKFLHVREDSLTTKQEQLVGQEKQQSVAYITDSWSYDRGLFLNTMNGLKCMGLFWIICAHSFMAGPITSNNILEADKLTKTYLADIYLAAHLMVDTFFAISGMLAAFFLFQAGLDNIKPKQWIILTIHRYWRLTPIYLICYWFAKSVAGLINSGPMWDYMTSEQSPRLNCARESWLEAILYMSDFKSPKQHCVPFAWFIANGIKFWIVTPIFLILINKSIRQGYMTTVSAILTSMVYVATVAMRADVDVESLVAFKPESANDMLDNLGEVYTRPQSRISPYLIGLLAGHLMYLIDKQQLEVKLSKTTRAILWTLFSVLMIALTFMMKVASATKLDPEALVVVFGICSATVRPIWALCICWLVFALAHGQARWLARFLTARCWRILVKLSFCAYLSQSEVIAQLFLSPSQANSFFYSDMICRPLVITTITIFVSFLMVLFLEFPLVGIEKLILPKRQNNPPQASHDEEKSRREKLKIT